MIEYEYTLERDYGVTKKTFKPTAIPTVLPNLVYIEGPNSIGKSALLHVLALSFHGLEKNGLNKALKERLKNLVGADYQKLTFNVHVTSRDGSLEIISRKEDMNDPEIVVYEVNNGKKKLMIPETFHERYNLIYDIPNDPSERLEQLIKEIEMMQGQQLIKVQRFRQYLTNLIEEIKRGKDPKKIEETSQDIVKLSTKNDQVAEEFNYKLDALNKIERYAYCKRFNECMIKLEQLEKEKKELEKIEKNQQKGSKKVNKDYEEAQKAAINAVRQLNEKKLDVFNHIKGFVPKDQKNLLEVWQGLDFNQYLKDLDLPTTFTRVCLEFRRIMEKEKKNRISDNDELIEAKVFSDLIAFLENYRETNVVIPGVEKTVDEFVDILIDKNQAHLNAAYFNKIYSDIKTNLDTMEKGYRNLGNKIGDIIRLRDKIPREDMGGPDVDDLMEKNSKEIDKANEKAEVIEIELHKRDVPLDSIELIIGEFEEEARFAIYLGYDGEQLQGVISSLRREVDGLKATKEGNDKALGLWRAELKRLESEKEHPYQQNKEDLDKIRTKVMKIESRMQEFDRYIINIGKKKKAENPPEKEENYNEAVFVYLGRKVGYIRHVDKEYKVAKIDMIERVIYTEINEKIHLDDMSTGQGQMAYLMGLLNPNDKRKIIALFDEVAMMSSKSLNPIYDRFRTLYEQDRLLIGIVVQKGEEALVVSKLEESTC